MGKHNKVSPSDVKKLAEECKNLAESLSFDDPVMCEENITSRVQIQPMEESMRFRNLFEYSIPTDNDRDVLSEQAKESDVYKNIVSDLEAELNQVAEIESLEEGVLDVVRKYAGKKLLTVAIIAQLISTGKVTAQQFSEAGVEPEKIEVAMDKVDTNVQGVPTNFNAVNVKALAVNDTLSKETVSDLNRSATFGGTNSSSDAYSFINAPYKLTTSENMAKAEGGVSNLHVSYKRFDSNSVNSTTGKAVQRGQGEFFVVGKGDDGTVTYTLSDYPSEVTVKSGDTLKFLGVQVWEGKSGIKASVFSTTPSAFANKLPAIGVKFFPGEGKSSMTIKGNSVSITLIYGMGTEDDTPEVAPLEMTSGDLFKYNSTDVDTTKASYRNMVDSLSAYISKYPDAKFKLTGTGSSSQVPTNYPSLTGEKTIEANLQLAKDRAKALGIQLAKDLSAKGIDIKGKVLQKTVDGKIGDIKYQNDPQNAERYMPDQNSGFRISTI